MKVSRDNFRLATNRLFDLGVFLLVVPATFYFGQLFSYKLAAGHPSVPALGVVAVGAGITAVLLGRVARPIVYMSDPKKTLVLLLFLLLLFGVGVARIPNLRQHVFSLRLYTERTDREEITPGGTLHYQDDLVRKRTPIDAVWTVSLSLPGNARKRHSAATAVFYRDGRASETHRVDLEAGGKPVELKSVGPADEILVSYESLLHIKFAGAALTTVEGFRAVLTNLGFVALPVVVLGLIAFPAVGFSFRVRRIVRHAKKIAPSKAPNDEPDGGKPPFWCLTAPEKTALALATAIVFLMHLPLAMPLELTADELYHNTFYSPPGDSLKGGDDVAFKTGRFTIYVVQRIVNDVFHVQPFGGSLLGCFLFSAGLLVAGLLLARLWRVSHSVSCTMVVMLFLGLHPYVQNFYFYRAGLIMMFVPLAVLPYLVARVRIASLVLCGLFLAIAVGSYQVIVNAAVASFLIGITLTGVEELKRKAAPSLARLAVRSRVYEGCAVTVLGVLFYVLLGRLFVILLSVPKQEYAGVASIFLWHQQAKTMMIRWLGLFSLPDGPFGASLNIVPVLLTAGGLAGIVLVAVRCGRRPAFIGKGMLRKRSLLAAVSVLCFLGASYSASLGVLFFVSNYVYPARIVMFFSVFLAGAFVVCRSCFGNHRVFRYTAFPAVGFLLVGYSFFLSQLQTDAYRLAMYDRALGQRIFAELEKQPDLHRVRNLFFVMDDHTAEFPYVDPVPSRRFGYLGSAFQSDHGPVELINAVSGRRFQWPRYKTPDYYERFSGLPPWPAPGSIVIDGDTAVVRL